VGHNEGWPGGDEYHRKGQPREVKAVIRAIQPVQAEFIGTMAPDQSTQSPHKELRYKTTGGKIMLVVV
jgi:hypothetical protein